MDYSKQATTRRIIEIARNKKMKDTELAAQLNIVKQNVQKLKKGQLLVPEPKIIDFLCLHRDIDPNWLLFGETTGEGEKTNVEEGHTVVVCGNNTINDKQLESLIAEKDRIIDKLVASLAELTKANEMQNGHISKLLKKI